MTIRPAIIQTISQVIILLVCLALPLSAQPEPMEQQSFTLIQKKVKGIGTDCEDPEFRVAFRVPLKWSVQHQSRWTDAAGPATTLNLRHPEGKAPVGLYYRLEDLSPASAEAIAQALQVEVDKKVDLRTRQGLQNYRVRTGNCRTAPGRHSPGVGQLRR